MRLDRIDLNLFVIFDAVYREGNITKVAQQLHLSQPAISNALARLRNTFDDQLFVRTPGGMLPTPVADNVIGDVRKALTLLRKSVVANARFNPESAEKRFQLGMNDLAQSLLLPSLRDKVQRQAPQVILSCYYQDRLGASDELKSGGIDLLLDTPLVNARDLEHRPLLDLPYVVAMRPDHPLAAEPMSIDAYVAAQHIHVSSRKRGRGHADMALHALGARRFVALRVQNYLVAAELARRSDLLWTTPRAIAEGMGLHSTELPFSVEPLKLHLFWNKGASDDPANQWLRGLILETVDDMTSP